MSARNCFQAKAAAGKVSARAADKLLGLLDEFERHHRAAGGTSARAAGEAAAAAARQAGIKANILRGNVIAQANLLRRMKVYEDTVLGLRTKGQAPVLLRGETQSVALPALRSAYMRDPNEIAAGFDNVDMLARSVRGRAHSKFAEAIEFLRPKKLGLAGERVREKGVLEAAYGDTSNANAVAVQKAWSDVAEDLRKQFNAAAGFEAIPERRTWRLPNPTLDAAKLHTFTATPAGRARLIGELRGRLDRDDMLDFETGRPLTDARLDALLEEVAEGLHAGHIDGLPSAAVRGRPMVANSRSFHRFFAWKSAEDWQWVAENLGTHQSVYESMLGHIHQMSREIALMRVLGPNPLATHRFALDLIAREPARLAVGAEEAGGFGKAKAINSRTQGRAKAHARRLQDAFDEVTGANRYVVGETLGKLAGDARALLAASQMGSAIISSITDLATVAMTARFNALPSARVLARASTMAREKGSEIFAAQQGLIADSIANTIGEGDRIMGDTIRTGIASKLASGTIRASGLRRWTASLRNAFGLEWMAHVARERQTPFVRIDPKQREAFDRYGIGEAEWDLIRATEVAEPRPGAEFIRFVDMLDSEDPAVREAGEKYARMVNTEMDYAVPEQDPVARAYLIGDSRAGTVEGEVRRGVGMYRNFTSSMITLHFARAFARGWDGRRLSHAALTFIAMTALGALSGNVVRQVLAGRSPRPMDPTTADGLRGWGAAVLQGGGLGVFGDMLFVDKTRYGNTWASIMAGPMFSTTEAVLGDFLMRNIGRAIEGGETYFLGDALYAAGRLTPGSSLWYARLAFQREILDQLALMIDPRAPERFRRIERRAAKDYGQEHWWRPGETVPRFAQ